MGDYVIRNLIEETTHTAMQMEVWLQRNAAACDIYVVVADETKRAESLQLVTSLRRAGISVDLPMGNPKVGKQFQSAEKCGARFALVVGAEYPELKLKVLVPRWRNDVQGELPVVPSVSSLWGIANWHEREAYDLVGIHFEGHPNLRRILCPEDWVGHALRKDYAFPLEYHGVRGR